MTSLPQPTAAGRRRVLVFIAIAFLGGTILLAIAGALITDPEAASNPLHLATTALVAAVCAALIPFTRSSSLRPVAATAPDQVREGWTRFNAATFVALAISDVPVVVALLIVSAFEGSAMVPVVGAVASAALIVVLAWPTVARVRAAGTRLDADGARTGLAQHVG